MSSLGAASGWSMDLGPHLLIRTSADDSAVLRAHAAGRLVRLAPGRYVRAKQWERLDECEREVMRIVAIVSKMTAPVVVSHESAAFLWGLPRIGLAEKPVEVIDPRVREVALHRGVRRRPGCVDPTDVVLLFGVPVTSLVRTCVDLAARAPFRTGVVALDAALRRDDITHERLLIALDGSVIVRGRARAADLIRFADPRANRPGESLSRCVMREVGVVPPDLQVEFRGPDGQRADVDFHWDEVGHVGEFDGKTKYKDSERWSGLQPHEVATNEKIREDWIRSLAQVHAFTRWVWNDVVTPGRLELVLRRAGVPFVRS